MSIHEIMQQLNQPTVKYAIAWLLLDVASTLIWLSILIIIHSKNNYQIDNEIFKYHDEQKAVNKHRKYFMKSNRKKPK